MYEIKKLLNKSKDMTQRSSSDLVGVDFSTTATKVVRLKKTKSELALLGIDLLPAVDFKTAARRIELPRNILANYGCLAYSGTASVVRMVNAPLAAEEDKLPEAKLRELLNVDADYRVSAMLAKRGNGRQDSSFLAAAVPEDDVRFLLNMFPAGPPAPASVEVAGLAFLPAFLNARAAECKDEAVCLIEAGESVSHFVFLNKGSVALVGKFGFGGNLLRAKVVNDLGVDDELAGTILTDRSINLSTTMVDVMTPFLKQLSISKDFIERHQGCRVSKVYVSGGLSLLPHWSSAVEQMLHAEVVQWSPFENIQYDPDVIPDEMVVQAPRFAAAVGAVIGGFEVS
jgi:Tfp pilus assembly PilM family ATPase